LAGSCFAGQIVAEPFLGIRHIQATEVSPRPLFISVVEIDLGAPGLSFKVTPQGPAPQPIISGTPQETVVQTTRQFVNGEGAQIAMNASFFASVYSGGWTNNLGLTASNGNAYSPWESPFTSGFDDALNITQTNVANIVTMPVSIPTGFETNPTVPLYNTVTGSHRLLTNGTNVAPAPNAGDSLTQINPRTAAGITADNKLLLMTVDGRQPGFSEGVTLVELASLLSSYGAVNAINLDGGGSTTLAFNYYDDVDSFGNPRSARLISSPVGVGNVVSTERSVGTNLGVFAQPNPNFTPPPVANAPSGGITVLDSFDSSEGRFTSGPTASGSTFGVSSNSQIDRVLNESILGEGSQRIVIQSSNPVTPGLGFRHLSGGGNPASNLAFASTGFAGFLLKVHDTGLQTGDLQVSLLLDDGSQLEAGLALDVVADGNWHLYQWNLDDSSQWFNFFNGNGQLDSATVTIDSLWFTSASNLDFTVFFDALSFNNNGDLSALLPEPIPEPSSAILLFFGLLVLARQRAITRRRRDVSNKVC
jgi:hypothetical protein